MNLSLRVHLWEAPQELHTRGCGGRLVRTFTEAQFAWGRPAREKQPSPLREISVSLKWHGGNCTPLLHPAAAGLF